MCAENGDDFGQGHVPQLVGESSGDQALSGVQYVIFHHKKPAETCSVYLSLLYLIIKHTAAVLKCDWLSRFNIHRPDLNSTFMQQMNKVHLLLYGIIITYYIV